MIIVVGATGYVGRYLCPYLSKEGYDVLALGNSEKGQHFLEEHGIRFQRMNLLDEEPFKHITTGDVEAIVDLAACLAEIDTPVQRFFDVNTIGVYKTLEFAHKNGIKRVIVTSTHKLYNNVESEFISEKDLVSFSGNHSPYIISKLAAEKFVEYYNSEFGMNGIVLRLTGVHGYGELLGHLEKDGSYNKSTFELFFEKILRGETIEVWGDQTIKRDHIYIKDVLSAIKAAIIHSNANGIFNIASGRGYSQYDEARALAVVFGGKAKSEIVLRPEKQGLTRGYVYDISKARSELEWNPEYVDILEMLKDYKKEWITKEYHNFHIINSEDRPATL